jgi:hypothetical protein
MAQDANGKQPDNPFRTPTGTPPEDPFKTPIGSPNKAVAFEKQLAQIDAENVYLTGWRLHLLSLRQVLWM